MKKRIALAGNPNSGKTSLFNDLTGANQYVGNWLGVTVDRKGGELKEHEEVEIQDAPSGIYVFCGDCRGTVEFAPWTAATVYVRHGSKLNIVAGDFAKVFIRLYDESEVSAEAEEDASVKVYDRRAIR